jgi:hypothetical protein
MMSVKNIKLRAPAVPKERRMTLAIEPRVAKLIRQVVRHEHILLSEFLEQAMIAWIRKWRPGWTLEVDGPEGPPKRTRLIVAATNIYGGGEPVARGPRRSKPSKRKRK